MASGHNFRILHGAGRASAGLSEPVRAIHGDVGHYSHALGGLPRNRGLVVPVQRPFPWPIMDFMVETGGGSPAGRR